MFSRSSDLNFYSILILNNLSSHSIWEENIQYQCKIKAHYSVNKALRNHLENGAGTSVLWTASIEKF